MELKEGIRSFETMIRMNFDNSKSPKITGLGIPYNKISDNPLPEYRSLKIKEKIAIGAFKRSVESDDIKMLWQHDPKYVLGRNRAGTLVLTENENGVYFENVPPDVGWARDLQVSIKRGDVGFASFKFFASIHWERWSGGELQVVDVGRLNEISIVTEPVYTSTSVFARSPEGILSMDGSFVDLIDSTVVNIGPRIINQDDLWKRLEKVNKRNMEVYKNVRKN